MVSLAAVPTTTVLASEVPIACVDGSTAQACADARARLTVMKQIQPISLFIAAVGAVILAFGAMQKIEPSYERVLSPEPIKGVRRWDPRNQDEMASAARVKQVKQGEMATCGNCNASVRDDALRCPRCGAEFAD